MLISRIGSILQERSFDSNYTIVENMYPKMTKEIPELFNINLEYS